MKKILYNIAFVAATALLMCGCTQDYPQPDAKGLPKASEFDVNIVVDNQTNRVTFTMNNKEVVPMWIFSDSRPDSSADKKKYAITVNGYTARFRDAGTHSVEIKAYNSNGISEGSIIKEFTLENTYRDPFDASPYMNAMSNSSSQEWVWNSSVAGHIGCGESGSDGLGWWSAAADEKADWSLYDDVLTFTADGQYTYDPTDGQVYVNKESGYKNEYNLNDGNDYVAPIDKYTTTYSIEQVWNDAGIEEIWLVLADGANLSYIPNPDALLAPRYRFLESSVSKMKKELSLVVDNGSIAWHYNFVTKSKVLTQEEILSGSGSKVWIMDAATPGHLGCGSSVDNPTEWWSAAAYDKADFGLYDDELTFSLDGSYSFNPGAGATIYVNTGVTLLGADLNPHDGQDFQVPYEVQNSTWSISGDKLVFPTQTVIGYVPNDQTYTTPEFVIKSLTENELVVVAVTEGISWQYRFIPRDALSDAPSFCGEQFESGKVEMALTNGQQITVSGIDVSTLWIDPDFFAVNGSDITFAAEDGDYRVVYDSANGWMKVMPLYNGSLATWAAGKAVWIIGTGGGKPSSANAIGWVTESALPMAKIAENTYQITISAVVGESVKLFGEAGWGGEWSADRYTSFNGNGYCHLGDGAANGDSGNIYFESGIDLSKFYRLTAVFDADDNLSMTVTQVAVEGVETPWEQGEQIDPSQYAKEIFGTWTWEPSTQGHVGCGETIANPTGWWSAAPYDKKDYSMYNDRITFSSDGKYTFDPVDGMTYVNVGVKNYGSEYNTTGQDFDAPAEVQTADFTIEKDGDYYCVVLPEGTLLSYLSNDEQLTNCKYYIMGMWDNALDLVWYTATGNGGGSIAWKYHFKRVN